jgi:hypothetical protein
MVAINTILIIVNGGPPVIAMTGRSGNIFAEKGGELAARSTKVPLTNSVIGWQGPRPESSGPGSLGLCNAASPATDHLDAIAAARSR